VRRFSSSFRRNRRFRPPGKAPGGRKKVWITNFFEALNGQVVGTNEFVDLFELVTPEDYTERIDTITNVVRRQEYATVVRTVGSLTVDVLTEAPGANGVLWSAAIFVRGFRSVFDEYNRAGAVGHAFMIHPEASGSQASDVNLNRLQPMAWMPERSWSGAFRENTLPAGCSDFFSDVNRPAQSEPWYFDVKQRRKMKTDDALWLLVSGVFICQVNEESPVFHTCLARTLIYDD